MSCPDAGMISMMKYGILAGLVLAILALPGCADQNMQRSDDKNRTQVDHNGGIFTLESVQHDVRAKYPAVKQLSTARLASMLAKPDNVLLLDVRELQEYNVSHLPGALQIQPLSALNSSGFLPTESAVKNKTVVFYCSVGVRSSRMAEKLQYELKHCGALAVYNLQGGIFAWHNENRILVNHDGRTDFVHPFDDKYKQLLYRQSLARYQP